MKYLELLAPAKNFDQGKAAIDHGADAVYIGAPLFGARSAAGNSIQDIDNLVHHAHSFGSKVFATVNTLLFDHELPQANAMIHQLYDCGVDALIIQDLGLLELDLPPIALHASTQMHNIDPRRVRFLQDVGFQRVILARETSINQMQLIRQQADVELEAFVQGALCVSYSGQCYLSQYLNEHSGNRGCCGQPCRSSYDLYNDEMRLLRREQHLLSLKDFSAVQHINSMIDAGITSFKIEGRLKDMSYVKNVTAFYRRLLDDIILQRNDCAPASDGTTRFFFSPDLSRTFNREFTDYFLLQRQPMASTDTQKSKGKYIGKVVKKDLKSLTIKTKETFTAGDGLCFFNTQHNLEGIFVNHVNGNTVYPNRMPQGIEVGTAVWRNNDFAFEKSLQNKSSERKINISLLLQPTPDGLSLSASDGTISVHKEFLLDKQPANDIERSKEQITKQLSKLGDTIFLAHSVVDETHGAYFIPASILNDMRRQLTQILLESRIRSAHPTDCPLSPNDIPYFESQLDYRANVINEKSAQFYRRHGVTSIEPGLEQSKNYDNKALMTTKYCLRYELKQCLLHKNNDSVSPEYAGNLILRNNKNYFLLQFDCKQCQMRILRKDN